MEVLLILYLSLAGGSVFSLGMTSASASCLGSLGFVEIKHTLVGGIYKLIGTPAAVVLGFTELGSHKEGAVLRAGIEVHISLIALIYPAGSLKLLIAMGAVN